MAEFALPDGRFAASAVTRGAREVGTEGKLDGQARVRNVQALVSPP